VIIRDIAVVRPPRKITEKAGFFAFLGFPPGKYPFFGINYRINSIITKTVKKASPVFK